MASALHALSSSRGPQSPQAIFEKTQGTSSASFFAPRSHCVATNKPRLGYERKRSQLKTKATGQKHWTKRLSLLPLAWRSPVRSGIVYLTSIPNFEEMNARRSPVDFRRNLLFGFTFFCPWLLGSRPCEKHRNTKITLPSAAKWLCESGTRFIRNSWRIWRKPGQCWRANAENNWPSRGPPLTRPSSL